MLDALTQQVDDAFFALICLAAATGIILAMRSSGRGDRKLMAGWLLIPLVLIPGWFLTQDRGERERRTEIGEIRDEKNDQLENAFAGRPDSGDPGELGY